MKEKRVSFGQGKGSITHNNRKFIADNIDVFRTHENITFVCQPISEAYEQLFAESTKRYNAKQKRNDRKIHGSYYEHLFGVKPCNNVRTAADKRKSFYEDVVQIGKMEDSGYGTEDFQLVAECLKEYMNGFQKRNPNFYVFNAVLHMDEATPHLHIDYIPIGHYKRGQDTQNGIAQALKEMGFGEGKQAIARWRSAEVEVLNQICREHGIEPLAPEKSRGTLEVAEYKEQRQKADALKSENNRAESEIEQKKSECQNLDGQIADKVAKINEILNYLPDMGKDEKLENKCSEIIAELDEMLKSKLSILKYKDDIIANVQKLCKLVKKVNSRADKATDTVYALREQYDKCEKERSELWQRSMERSGKINELTRNNSDLQRTVDSLTEFIDLLKRFEPQKYSEVRALQEHIRTQQEVRTNRKKMCGLE